MDTTKKLTEISKFLSLILRHKPEEIGIELDSGGWADVKQLVKGVAAKYPGFNSDILKEIVQTDEKQRYSFNEKRTKIRANQGHSIPVNLGLESVKPPKYLYHGSGKKYKDDIWRDGLLPKSRQYVHLSDDVETAIKVGKRHGEPVVFRVKSEEMYRRGFKFYRSVNGVWLTERVPCEYIHGVYHTECLTRADALKLARLKIGK
jgi:putative RNA 2'-phosphotransferase